MRGENRSQGEEILRGDWLTKVFDSSTTHVAGSGPPSSVEEDQLEKKIVEGCVGHHEEVGGMEDSASDGSISPLDFEMLDAASEGERRLSAESSSWSTSQATPSQSGGISDNGSTYSTYDGPSSGSSAVSPLSEGPRSASWTMFDQNDPREDSRAVDTDGGVAEQGKGQPDMEEEAPKTCHEP